MTPFLIRTDKYPIYNSNCKWKDCHPYLLREERTKNLSLKPLTSMTIFHEFEQKYNQYPEVLGQDEAAE